MRLPFLILSSLALAAAGRATDYNFVTIDVPGADRTLVLDINNSGQLAGYAVTDVPGTPGLYTAFTGNADGTGFAALGRAGTIGLGASGINSFGAISGVSVDQTVTAKGFVRSASGTYVDIDPSTGGLTSAYSEAVDLNDNGTVVGFYTESQPADEQAASIASHGYIYTGGVYSTLDYPGAGNHGTQLYSVNIAGTVSGRYLDSAEVSHGFLYSEGLGFVDLSIPGFASTESDGINNNGDFTAIGYMPFAASPTGVLPFSFIHTGGAYVPFSVPGALATVAYSLNDHGQVVGLYVTNDFKYHGFTATPVPEPASFVALGLGGLGALRRRRKV